MSEEEMNITVVFDKKDKVKILDIFDKSVDDAGFIVDNKGRRVETPDGDDIRISDFAGIKKGSELFFKSDFPTLLELVKD